MTRIFVFSLKYVHLFSICDLVNFFKKYHLALKANYDFSIHKLITTPFFNSKEINFMLIWSYSRY